MIHENTVSPISTYVTFDCPSHTRMPYGRVRIPGNARVSTRTAFARARQDDPMGNPYTAGILVAMAMDTTIKVDRALRDRLNAAAREQGMTPARLLDILLAEYERQRWVEGAVAEMNAAPPEVWADYLREVESMDDSLMDGLEDEPPYPLPRWIEWLEGHGPRPDDVFEAE